MLTVIGVIGFLLVSAAIMMRVFRRATYEEQLESAENDKMEAQFWLSPNHPDWQSEIDDANRLIKEIQKERYGSGWQRFKFNLISLLLAIPGAILILLSYAERDWDGIVFFAALLYGLWLLQENVSSPIAKLQAENRWLRRTLHSVKDMAESAARKDDASSDGDLQSQLNSLRDK